TPLHMGTKLCGDYDLVAALRSPFARGAWRRELTRFGHAVAYGGILYLEVDEPALLRPPALLKGQLKRLGFSAARFYWPKPGFRMAEMLLPLGIRSLQRYYLDFQFF